MIVKISTQSQDEATMTEQHDSISQTYALSVSVAVPLSALDRAAVQFAESFQGWRVLVSM